MRPKVTIVLCSHDKPGLVAEAAVSIMNQDYDNWQGILVDSGELYNAGYFRHEVFQHPNLEIMVSNEPDSVRRKEKNPAPWVYNWVMGRRRMVQGDLLMFMCDDDMLRDECFETFVAFFNENPTVKVAYCSQDLTTIDNDGKEMLVGKRTPPGIAGKASGGLDGGGFPVDCHIDGLQVMIRREVWQPWPEEPSVATHADGVWLESLGALYPLYPVVSRKSLTVNRRTPLSTYAPYRPQDRTTEQIAPVLSVRQLRALPGNG